MEEGEEFQENLCSVKNEVQIILRMKAERGRSGADRRPFHRGRPRAAGSCQHKRGRNRTCGAAGRAARPRPRRSGAGAAPASALLMRRNRRGLTRSPAAPSWGLPPPLAGLFPAPVSLLLGCLYSFQARRIVGAQWAQGSLLREARLGHPCAGLPQARPGHSLRPLLDQRPRQDLCSSCSPSPSASLPHTRKCGCAHHPPCTPGAAPCWSPAPPPPPRMGSLLVC